MTVALLAMTVALLAMTVELLATERGGRTKRTCNERLLSQSQYPRDVCSPCTRALRYPLDLCRARLAVMRNSSAASTATFPLIVKGIVAENGFRGLYLGITPTLAGMMPYAGLAFTMNDHLRRLVKTTTGKDVTTPQKLVAGGVSGLVAQSLTYPLDVTRRRMQTTGLVFTDLLNGKVETTEQAGKKQKTPTITNVMRAVFAEQVRAPRTHTRGPELGGRSE